MFQPERCPMPALKNPRHEAFAQSYVRGETAGNATASYRKAFGKDDRKSAARCLRRDDVSQRIRELNAQVGALQAQATTKALERYEVTAERIIGELARMGFALDYIRVTDGGAAVVDLSALDRDKATAISEVVVDVVQDGKGEGADTVKRVRFKLADKRAALVDLGKHLGMFVDRKHVTLEHGDKTDDELRNELADLVEQFRALGVGRETPPRIAVARCAIMMRGWSRGVQRGPCLASAGWI